MLEQHSLITTLKFNDDGESLENDVRADSAAYLYPDPVASRPQVIAAEEHSYKSQTLDKVPSTQSEAISAHLAHDDKSNSFIETDIVDRGIEHVLPDVSVVAHSQNAKSQFLPKVSRAIYHPSHYEPLGVEAVFSTGKHDSNDICFCKDSLRQKSFDLKNSFIQRRLYSAYGRNIICRQKKGAMESIWPLYETTKNTNLCFVVRKGEAPSLEWIGNDQTLSELPVLSGWFEKIDWEQKLARYATSESSDLDLPPFGESDSDEEAKLPYSMVREIISEECERQDRQDNSRQSAKPLSAQQVQAIIDERKLYFREVWERKKLPRLQRRARKSYIAFHSTTKSSMMRRREQLEREQAQSLDRQYSLLLNIREHVYTSSRPLRFQCESVRETVYQLADLEFYIHLFRDGAAIPENPSFLSEAILRSRTRVDDTQDAENFSDLSSEDPEYVLEQMDQPILEIDDEDEDQGFDSGNEYIGPMAGEFTTVQNPRRLAVDLSEQRRSTSTEQAQELPDVIVLSSDSSDSETSALIHQTTAEAWSKSSQQVGLKPPRGISSHSTSRHQVNRNRAVRAESSDVYDRYDKEVSRPETITEVQELDDKIAMSQRFTFRQLETSDDSSTDSQADIDFDTTENIESTGFSFGVEDTGSLEDAVSEQEMLVNAIFPATGTHNRQHKSGQRRIEKRTVDSDSDNSDESPLRKRQKTRPINKQALKRRLDQQQERVEIAKRAHEQLKELTQDAADGICINIGDNETDEVIYIASFLAKHLKAHQIEGVRFMWRECVMMKDVNGCLLAHTMGLGKTLQVITFIHTIGSVIRRAKNLLPRSLRKPYVLVLAPASLVPNWFQELQYWTPENAMGSVFNMVDYVNRDEHLEVLRYWKAEGGIMLLSYSFFVVLMSDKFKDDPCFADENKIQEVQAILCRIPSIVIADEAHMFKNEVTQLSKAMHKISTDCRIALTGSPLTNNLLEYWAIVDWIEKGYLGEKSDFTAEYVRDIDAGNSPDATKSQIRQGQKKTKLLTQIIGDKMNRRGIKHLVGLLPQKFEYVLFIKFGAMQKEIYNSYLKLLHAGQHTRTSQLLAAIARLKTIVNHPALLLSPFTYKERRKKHDKDPSPLEDSLLADERKRVTEWREGIVAKYEAALTDVNASHKLSILLEICREALKLQEKVLIFSFSISTINLIRAQLDVHGLGPVQVLTGTDAAKHRVRDVDAFNSRSGYAVLLVSTKAGGLGLNMTGANRVILYDHEWSPVYQEQAIGRAYRLGQKKTVYVYKLQIQDSFETKLFEQSLTKLGLTSKVIDKTNLQTTIAKSKMVEYFRPAPVEDKETEEILELGDVLLSRVLDTCKGQVVSVQTSESFHQEEENMIEEADLLEISERFAAYTRQLELKKLAQEKTLAGDTDASAQLTGIVSTAAGAENNAVFSSPNTTKDATLEGIDPEELHALVEKDTVSIDRSLPS